jgi:hypothetical protein
MVHEQVSFHQPAGQGGLPTVPQGGLPTVRKGASQAPASNFVFIFAVMTCTRWQNGYNRRYGISDLDVMGHGSQRSRCVDFHRFGAAGPVP